jgi:hypothetical protein
MQRRSFIASLGLMAIISNIPLLKANEQIPMKKVNFRHVVYFWLNNPEDASEKRQFLNNLKDFIEKMDNIQDKYIGQPAETDRDVVDNTYQYCLNLGFENKSEHDIYQDHIFHKQFIDKTAHLWKRVLVYDSVPA